MTQDFNKVREVRVVIKGCYITPPPPPPAPQPRVYKSPKRMQYWPNDGQFHSLGMKTHGGRATVFVDGRFRGIYAKNGQGRRLFWRSLWFSLRARWNRTRD